VILFDFLPFYAIGDAAAEQLPRVIQSFDSECRCFHYRKFEAESLRRTGHLSTRSFLGSQSHSRISCLCVCARVLFVYAPSVNVLCFCLFTFVCVFIVFCNR